jgi:hypothetical protein
MKPGVFAADFGFYGFFIVELAIGSHSCACTGSNQYLAAERLMRY